MTDDELAAGDRALREVLATPVGRRWVLKMAGATGVGWAVAGMLPSPAAADSPAAASSDSHSSAGSGKTTYHFALGAAARHVVNLELWANGERVRLRRHTAQSRARLLAEGTLWHKVNRRQLTHYASVRVPTNRTVVMAVHGRRRDKLVILAQHTHTPPAWLRTVALAAYRVEGSYRSVLGPKARLNNLGLTADQVRSVDEVTDLNTVFDPHMTAITMCSMHPNVATIGTVEHPITQSLVGQASEVGTLGDSIEAIHNAGQNWATKNTALNADGTPTQIKINQTVTTFTTVVLNPDPTFRTTIQTAVVASIRTVRNTGTLGKIVNQPLDALQDKTDTSTWHASQGVVPSAQPYQPPTDAAAAVTAQVQKPGLVYGTYTTLDGGYSGGQQKLKLYNNYVRWVWVYVQYLDASGNNLSANANATFPDTSDAQSLGLLPQIFTVLGIPIWDTNTIDVTLNFPQEATSARILYCGLGDNAVGDEWRQFFANYPSDLIAPTKEVEVASIITGVFTIGLTAFALLTDVNIASLWGEVREIIEEDPMLMVELVQEVLARPPWLTAADSAAATMAAGAATYEDIAANGNANNIWSVLLGLGSLIPKIIFNPAAAGKLAEIALAIGGGIALGQVERALPLIGEVVAVIEAVGDAITLAEAIGETIASPWVIDNLVSLTYPATVTASKDPRASTWPPTARSWRIEATIDGSSAVDSVTGTFNADGNSTDDIVLSLTPPFGGKTITWSMVVLDAAGHQVGTAAAQFPNDDAANPASTVALAITELPATVDANTSFGRDITTTFGADGYTWELSPADTGTAQTNNFEVTGVTVSTRLGVVGIVWKADDKYWLRGVPIGENGNSITLGGATKQGYARRPYLLFDALVGAGDIGNHVILEPEDTGSGYFVRALTIDPATGQLSWDPTTSLAYFALPVDAAALLPSGWVVAIHTDSGRLGHVLPTTTPHAALARYTAGPGTEIGLLSSPAAVAASTRGMVIVLETNASTANPYQLSAFDVLGNPTPYFGPPTSLAYTLPLPTGRTYLDVALDGSNFLYLLSYAGTGSQPDQYFIDVFNPDGTPLVTNSPGTNVPHLAVDYWRSIYAANYTPLVDASGNAHIDPLLGVIEPSLSRFDPSDPPPIASSRG